MRTNELATAAREDYRSRPYNGGGWEPGAMSGGFSATRDADALELSNHVMAIQAYEAAGVEVSVDHFGHWAVGWIDHITVPITRAAITVLEDLNARIENYPVLDDEDFSEREWDSDHPDDGHCYSEQYSDGDPCPCGLPRW